ncbi:MAG: hypothetical protein RSA91_01535 [Bacilli bacterium]
MNNSENLFINEKDLNNLIKPSERYIINSLETLKKVKNQKQEQFDSKLFTIKYANKSVLIRILNRNLSHPLGLQNNKENNKFIYDKLSKTDNYSNVNFLDLITNNIDDLIKLQKNFNKPLLNYYRINEKSKIFYKTTNFDNLEFNVRELNIQEKSALNYKPSLLFEKKKNLIGIFKDEEENSFLETFPNKYCLDSNYLYKPSHLLIENVKTKEKTVFENIGLTKGVVSSKIFGITKFVPKLLREEEKNGCNFANSYQLLREYIELSLEKNGIHNTALLIIRNMGNYESIFDTINIKKMVVFTLNEIPNNNNFKNLIIKMLYVMQYEKEFGNNDEIFDTNYSTNDLIKKISK